MKHYVLATLSIILGASACRSLPVEKEPPSAKASPTWTVPLTKTQKKPDGRSLFLKNCAHCHGADARGDEGPDLHSLDWSPEQISKRIQNGKKGQMTAFKGKLQPTEINSLVEYVRTLK